MKRYLLGFSLVRVDDGVEIWSRTHAYLPEGDEANVAFRTVMSGEFEAVLDVIKDDVQGQYLLGHWRVANSIVESSQLCEDYYKSGYSGEKVYTFESDCDFSTNYRMAITINEVVPVKPRNRIVERFARLLRGE
ncbi:hypothetical protein B7N40_24870 [Salmonella enterica subsp. enterica serovar Bovismorbificans]|uniref:Uncharacterized protein n=2 Tax=Agtrevirus TaxID=2169532 RepID=A0A6G6XTQ2_9CAUD|nr:hypothetical protein HYP84_gp036 [Shigella phage MK-13]YP_009889487.1 hypothetical protein HYQ39_gp148 [Salmonella phage P46FS4]EBS2632492.1 hypothetical protein [Salmonella enterica subsp. enterica serovar Gatuni]EBW9290544.1 hypothetical protein [Salmonella enterica subsp. enterica serovar Bovismorbificans]QBJ04269.1 hypothetical protein MK13_00036 [Shigella phage MK-13]QIG62214.1 hypothetical protein P46FS4_148 [Salmonella phage P46FS4]